MNFLKSKKHYSILDSIFPPSLHPFLIHFSFHSQLKKILIFPIAPFLHETPFYFYGLQKCEKSHFVLPLKARRLPLPPPSTESSQNLLVEEGSRAASHSKGQLALSNGQSAAARSS